MLSDAPDFFWCGSFCRFVYPPGGGFLGLDLLFDPFGAWGRGGPLRFVWCFVFPQGLFDFSFRLAFSCVGGGGGSVSCYRPGVLWDFRRFVILPRVPVPESCSCDLLSVYSASWGVALLKLLALSRQREGGPGSSCPGPGGNHCLCHNNTPSRRASRVCAVVGRDTIASSCR